MRKLTDKLKYDFNDDGAILYAKRKDNGKWDKLAICHESVIDYIRQHGFKAAMELGCIKWIEAA